jgi:hypothetical protein
MTRVSRLIDFIKVMALFNVESRRSCVGRANKLPVDPNLTALQWTKPIP